MISCCGAAHSKLDNEILLYLNSKSIEKFIPKIRKTIASKQQDKAKMKETMNSIKRIIKANRTAKNKFYALLILNEIMKLKKAYIGKHFGVKMGRRMSILASQNPEEKNLWDRGQTCLDM